MEIQQIRHLAVLDQNGDLLKVLGLADMLQVIEHSYVHLLEEVLEEKNGSFLPVKTAFTC
jgi:hypothetical protein